MNFKITLILLLTNLGACSPQPNSGQAAPPPRGELSSSPQLNVAVEEPETSVTQFLQQMPLMEERRRPGLLRAWRKIPDHYRYRKPRASDFENSNGIANENFRSYDYGEIAGAYGLAMIVVDKTIAGLRRFGLLILIERPANRYDAYWIYQDKDLSKVTLNRHSGNVYLAGTGDDGVDLYCDIKWGRSERRWTCKGP